MQPIHRSALLIAVMLSAFGGAGCLRLGYGERSDAGSAKSDAGTHAGGMGGSRAGSGGTSGKSGAGGAAGSSGSGGKAGMPSDGGSPDSGAADGSMGMDDSDGGDVSEPNDAGTDAGSNTPNDAGVADSGTPFVDCPAYALFCDEFEDNFGGWDYHVESNGTYALSTAHVHSGTYSFVAKTGPAMQNTWVRWATEALAQQKSGDAWMRFYNWVPSSVVVTEHFSVGVMSEAKDPFDGFELRILPDNVDINSTPGVFAGSMAFPRDKWVCVELHAFIHASLGYYEAYIDGDLAAKTDNANTVTADGLTAAEVGVHYAGPNQGPVEVYVDNVVVARQRIPCE